jgi:hypothetical protein
MRNGRAMTLCYNKRGIDVDLDKIAGQILRTWDIWKRP